MANGKDHAEAGVLGGGIMAACYACQEKGGNLATEILGGVGGGLVGAKLPDWIDPPSSCHHRSTGHGVLPTGTCALKYARALPAMQAWLRVEALRQQQIAEGSEGWQYLWHALLALACRLGAGALAGLLGGYVSHLVLDAHTPMGLPAIA